MRGFGKTILLLMLLASFSLGVAACGKKAPPRPPHEPPKNLKGP